MRILAALVLLVQLQPLVGSALCLHDAEMVRDECSMPHEERSASSKLTTPQSSVPGGCPSMEFCASAAPAVPNVAEQFQLTAFVHGAPALMDSSLAPGEGPAPPFDPPKA
jgi:hypothetical protein